MLTRCELHEKALYAVLREKFTRDERTGIHLTDCLEPRLAYWKSKIPLPPTDAEVGYFTAGRGHEDTLTKLLEGDFISTPEEEIDGIHLRPDWQAISNRIIPDGEYAEFKTRRSNLPKSDEEAQEALKSYRDQVIGYQALKRRQTMYLIVLSLMEGKDRKDPLSQSRPVFAVYRETLTKEELEKARHHILASRDLLVAGETKIMPVCTKWKCVRSVKVAANWITVPACKWHAACAPGETDPSRNIT